MTQLADFIIFFSGVIFCAGLVPTVWHQFKVRQCTVPLTSSLTTASALAGLVVAYVILGLWVALISISVNLLLWLVVALQRWGYTKTYAIREPRAARRRKHRDQWMEARGYTRLSPSEVQDGSRHIHTRRPS